MKIFFIKKSFQLGDTAAESFIKSGMKGVLSFGFKEFLLILFVVTLLSAADDNKDSQGYDFRDNLANSSNFISDKCISGE